MNFRPTAIAGLLEIQATPSTDARGAFIRTYCRDRFAAAGIGFTPCQISLSENLRRHTLRGMHWQAPPAAECKLVRCLQGAVHDVVLDLRPDSASRGRHVAVTLSAANRTALFIPAGCAHGFLTLTDDATLEYLMDVPHAPAEARGLRWNDPAFALPWPAPPAVLSVRDASWPDHG
jgi:dTDP-4-dehydrorhamnose 3,5-epimerase